MNENNKTIAIGKHKDPYTVPLSLIQLSKYIQYIIPNANREWKDIFKLLELDSSSRNRKLNTIDYKTDARERMTLQNINKGLSMELFGSGIFSHFDHPSEIHSNCVVKRFQSEQATDDNCRHIVPNNYAPSGLPDVVIDYTTYILLLEVSAKSKPPLAHFRSQLDGAVLHARAIREEGCDKPIYCLVINARSLNVTENKIALGKVLEEIKPSEQIFITVTSIQELGDLGQKMAERYEDYISKVRREDLLSVLTATVEKGTYGQFHEEFGKFLFNLKLPPSFAF